MTDDIKPLLMYKCKPCCPQTFQGSASAESEQANINSINGGGDGDGDGDGGGGAWSEEQDFPALISSICPNFRLVTIL